MAAQVFKDPYLFDFLGTAPLRREAELEMLVEYTLSGHTKPMGVANWAQQIQRTLPEEFKSSLPSVEEIESELQADFGAGVDHAD
jgi:hypothetical protein